MNILDKIIEYKYSELEHLKIKYSYIDDLSLFDINEHSLIEKFNSDKRINVIAEIKRGSPSKGLFAKNLDVACKSLEYESNGASCVSVLTDEKYFYGSYETMKLVRESISLPILCKDFIVDEFQIKLAKYFGANVILLIKRVLDEDRFLTLLKCARKYNLEVLVEVDDEEEFKMISHHDFLLCGVNNRDLSDFSVDLVKTKNLSKLIKESGKFLISESGISSKEQILDLRLFNIDGVLVGESLIKETNSNLLTDLQILKERVEVKICGVKDLKTAIHVEKSGADYIGFVFTESKRRIDSGTAKYIISKLDSIKTIGVFRSETPEDINRIYKECKLDYVQIHGYINLDKLKIAKKYIIPAVPYNEGHPTDYEYILIDGQTPGSGKVYNLNKLSLNSDQSHFLAGGLNKSNIIERINMTLPCAVDVSSGVETNGLKDFNKITEFINIVGGL